MKKILLFIVFLIFSTNANSHTDHYKKISKIELEILKDGKTIGFCNYDFIHSKNTMEVHNNTEFEVEIFGVKVFFISSKAIEKYKNNQLIYFESKTQQNKKKKYVNLRYQKNTNNFLIEGSSFNGIASAENVVGNWWNHKILQSTSQISPLSGSVKKQVVTFVKKEKINLYGKNYLTHRFKLKSENSNLSDDKKLDFDIWFEPEKNLILKISYSRMGNWEYRLKNIITN